MGITIKIIPGEVALKDLPKHKGFPTFISDAIANMEPPPEGWEERLAEGRKKLEQIKVKHVYPHLVAERVHGIKPMDSNTATCEKV